MKKLLALLAVLGLTTMANAGIQFMRTAGTEVAPGLKSYTIYAVSDSNEQIKWASAFDGNFAGKFNQLKVSTFKTPTLDVADGLANPALDTHFLFYNPGLYDAEYPEENQDKANQLLGVVSAPNETGTLTTAGIIGFKAGFNNPNATLTDVDKYGDPTPGMPLMTKSLALIQIVTNDANWATAGFYGSVADGLGVKYYEGSSNTNQVLLSGLQVIPEPMTMSLLAVGALALIRRRLA